MDTNKTEDNKINKTSLSKEASIKEKARKGLKDSSKTKNTNNSDLISKKAKATVSKKSKDLYVDVPLRKDVKGIPRAKLDVFSKQDSSNRDENEKKLNNKAKKDDKPTSRKINTKNESRPSHREDSRPTNRTPSKTSSLKNMKSQPTKKSSNSSSLKNKDKNTKSENKTIKNQKNASKSKTSSNSKTNKKSDSSSLSNSDKENKKTKGEKAKDSNNSIEKIVNLLQDRQLKGTLKYEDGKDIKKRRQRRIDPEKISKKNKEAKKYNSLLFKILNYKINAKFNIKLYYLLLLIIILVGLILFHNEVYDMNILKKNISNETVQSMDIVKPVHDESFDSNFIFVGDNLNDLDVINKTINKQPSLLEENNIVDISDDSLSDGYIKITIEDGLSATQIASLLDDKGLCDKNLFIDYVVENGFESKLRSGIYVIEKDSNVSDIVSSIIDYESTIVTIYAASTIDQVDKLLTSRKLIYSGDFYKACVNACEKKGLEFVEGYFSPAKYKITNDFDVNLLAETMLENTFKFISPYLKDIANSSLSINDIIIIASLIQGETQDANQMPIISSVIHNRLKKDMPLGIDATTRYELNDWQSELTQDIFEQLTPYNTRRVKGLPPSGICFSSSEAIYSAIFPKDTNYLYYIHDKEGNLITALDYDQHLRNIEERDNS